jgi:phage tail sheath gpL-like
MSITFTQIVERDIPEIQFEINLRGGNALPNQQAYKDIYVFAERVTAGTSAANEVRTVPFGGEAEARAWFGEGSAGAFMASCVYNYRGSDGRDSMSPKSQVYGVAVAESAGVAATLVITFATTATGSGTFELLIGGHLVKVGVATDDTPTIAGDKLVAAFNALPNYQRIPFTPVNAVGAVTFTATSKGAHFNTFGFSVLTSPAGIGMTCTAASAYPVNGTLYPTLTTALANMLAVRTPLIVCPWGADNTTMELLVTHAETKAAAGSELPCRVMCAVNDSVSNLVTAADNLDDDDGQRICMVGTRGLVAGSSQVAAEVAAADASEPHLARSLNGVSLPNIYPPTAANRFTKAETNTLTAAGVTALWIPPGDTEVRIVRAVSIRTDFGPMDWATMIDLDYCRGTISARISAKYVRMSIVESTLLKTTAAHVTTPQAVRAEIYSCLKDLEAEGNLYDVDTYWGNSSYGLVDGRLRLQLPAEMVPQWHQTYGRIDATV